MSKISTQYEKFVLLAVAAIALAACGGSRENRSTASTVARTKNAALPTETTVSTPSCATGGVCVVGDIGPGGGKVFYVAPTLFTSTGSACGSACKYLEAAPVGWIKANTPTGQTNCNIPGTSSGTGTNLVDPQCEWSGNIATRIGTTSNAIGAGYANTSAMIAQSNVEGRAATVARAFQGGGKTDWYLPSFDELNLLYLQRYQMGRFSFGFYWSSSENDASGAWNQYFGSGYQSNNNKTDPNYVRPVRAVSVPATLTCATGGACVVGDTGPGGGKVFYVAPTSFASTGSACGTACKYLEAAPIGWITAATPAGQTNCRPAGTSTQDPQCEWSGNIATRIGTTSNAIGAGYANTSAIITQSNVAGRAATVARAFQGGGKTDWYLPSKDELIQMSVQRSTLGIFCSGAYWSSSENDASFAWFLGFNCGYANFNYRKSSSYFVRPVRAF